MRKIATIDGSIILEEDDGRVHFFADADVDSDGPGGSRQEDPDWQAETSLRFEGKSLDARKVPFIVVPKIIIQGVRGIVLGSLARVTHTGLLIDGAHPWTWAVVGDVGPSRLTGEVSVECARRLRLDPNPRHGGTEDRVIFYEIWPGKPAVIDKIEYHLQPWK